MAFLWNIATTQNTIECKDTNQNEYFLSRALTNYLITLANSAEYNYLEILFSKLLNWSITKLFRLFEIRINLVFCLLYRYKTKTWNIQNGYYMGIRSALGTFASTTAVQTTSYAYKHLIYELSQNK